MTGYQSMDEFFRLTNKSFHNLIREDEQQQIEASIWEQIDSGNENDYIHFHLRKADGSYLSVLDHGRIVESPQYGKVFYVLFMDWEDMHIHYSDKFSGYVFRLACSSSSSAIFLSNPPAYPVKLPFVPTTR